MRRHECAVLREESGNLIVVAGIEGSDEILSEIANQGLQHPRTDESPPRNWNRADTSTTSWGKAKSGSTARWKTLSMQRHSSAKRSVEAGKICEEERKNWEW